MGDDFRRLIRVAVAATLYYSGILRLWLLLRQKVLRRREICVLCLHRVLNSQEQLSTGSLPGMVFREDTFAKLLECLRNWFDVISLDAFLSGSGRAQSSSRPKLLLTFDDGWGDNYWRAFPLLKRLHMPAVIFVVTSFVEGKRLFWVERVAKMWHDPIRREEIHRRLLEAADGRIAPAASFEEIVEQLKCMPTEERNRILDTAVPDFASGAADQGVDQPLDWDQIQEMSRDGVEFASHTVTHPLLPYEDDATVERELKLAKQNLEEKLHTRIRAFAYPNGAWDKRVRRIVQESGHECAFTTRRGWHRAGADPYTICRVTLHEGIVTGPVGKLSRALLAMRLFAAF